MNAGLPVPVPLLAGVEGGRGLGLAAAGSAVRSGADAGRAIFLAAAAGAD